MGAAEDLAGKYVAAMAEVIGFAESASDAEWRTVCPAQERTVGVLFDHIGPTTGENASTDPMA